MCFGCHCCFILFVYLFMIIFNDHFSHSIHRMGNGVERGERERERERERKGKSIISF